MALDSVQSFFNRGIQALSSAKNSLKNRFKKGGASQEQTNQVGNTALKRGSQEPGMSEEIPSREARAYSSPDTAPQTATKSTGDVGTRLLRSQEARSLTLESLEPRSREEFKNLFADIMGAIESSLIEGGRSSENIAMGYLRAVLKKLPQESGDDLFGQNERNNLRALMEGARREAKFKIGAEQQGASPEQKKLLSDLREIVKRDAFKVFSATGQTLPMTWITGSKSSSLVGIEEVAARGISDRLALLPTGTLLEHNIIPLSGELKYGIEKGKSGVNRSMLSGVKVNDYLVSINYSKKKEFAFDLAATKKYLGTLMTVGININRLEIEVYRYLKMREVDDPDGALYKARLLIIKESEHVPKEMKIKIEELAELFDTEQPLNLSDTQKSLISSPFPIVWAANIPESRLVDVSTNFTDVEKGETGIAGSVSLGAEDGVRVAFTKKRDLPRLQAYIEEKDLNIVPLTMGTIAMVQLMNMARQNQRRGL